VANTLYYFFSLPHSSRRASSGGRSCAAAMCEYWKSVPMWRCPYCKCNIQDTKASRAFHEGGKRHKEALERHHTLLGIKGLQRDQAKDALDRELKHIEAAALASYMAHDLNGVLHSVPEKDIKALLRRGRPLEEEFSRVTTNTSSMPAYGTKEYAEWYRSSKQFHHSQGDEKAMAHIVAPPERYTESYRSADSYGKGGDKGSGGGKGGKGNGKGFDPGARDRASPAAGGPRPKPPRPPDSPTAESLRPPRPPPPAAPPPPPLSPPLNRANDNDDDDLESFDSDDRGEGLRIGDWTTVAVRPVAAQRTGSGDEGPSEGDEEELPDSCDEANQRTAFDNLRFNFSRQPDTSGRHGGEATGFRVTTYANVSVAAEETPRRFGSGHLKAEPAAASSPAALHSLLTPLSETVRRPVKLEAPLKLELEGDYGPSAKRKEPEGLFPSRARKQFRRRTEDED